MKITRKETTTFNLRDLQYGNCFEMTDKKYTTFDSIYMRCSNSTSKIQTDGYYCVDIADGNGYFFSDVLVKKVNVVANIEE